MFHRRRQNMRGPVNYFQGLHKGRKEWVSRHGSIPVQFLLEEKLSSNQGHRKYTNRFNPWHWNRPASLRGRENMSQGGGKMGNHWPACIVSVLTGRV